MPAPVLSWLLLAAAFSPVLIDLAQHYVQRPWAAYSFVFACLFALELRRAPAGRARPALGWTLLAGALALELLLVAGGLTRAARAALALGAFGLTALQGRPGLRSSVLLLGFVPIPTVVVSATSPELEARLAEWAASLLQLAGSPALVERVLDEVRLRTAHEILPISGSDGGLSVAVLLAGLVWYAGCRRERPPWPTAAAALACMLLAFPVQVAAIAIAGALVESGGPARFVLDVLPWLVVATIGLVLVHRPARAPDPTLPSSP